MRFTRAVLMPFVVLSVFTTFSIKSQADSPSTTLQMFRPGELIVEIKSDSSIEEINERNRTTTIQRIYGTNFYRLRTPEGKSNNHWLNRLSRDKDVLSASFNPVVMNPPTVLSRSTVGFPDGHATPGRSRAEYISQANLYELLGLGDTHLRSRGAGVIVAVIDTGIDRSHPDLASHIWRENRQSSETESGSIDNDRDSLINDAWGWDFVDNDNDPTETAVDPATSVAGHGTFIAGLIALVAPDCKIMPIRAFISDGTSNAFTVAAAIKYAVDHGAKVINLSFGSPKKSSIVRSAIRYARQNGAVLVAAMGNDNEDTDDNPQYPANWRDVIGVAAIDAESRKASFSNFGNCVGVDALGVKLTSTYPGGEGRSADYAMWSGTSFAAPLTAAEAALIIAQDDRRDAGGTIEETAIKIDDLNPTFSGKLGRGRIDPLVALDTIYVERSEAGNYASVAFTAGREEATGRGEARVAIIGSLGELDISAQALNPYGRYDLFVNGKNITPDGLYATDFGGLAADFSTGPKSTDEPDRVLFPLPVELIPVAIIKHVELRDGDHVVLQADFTPIVGSVGPRDQLFEKVMSLIPDDRLSKTGGKARIEVEGDREEFIIAGTMLASGAPYQIYVDGANVGVVIARSDLSQSGFVRAEFGSSDLSESLLPPSLRPVIKIRHVELRDLSNRVILEGDFLAGGDDIGGNHTDH